MKQVLALFLALLAAASGRTQVAVNATNAAPHGSAMLDVTSTNRGFLMPRMTDVQRTSIASPATGLLVYETTSNAVWVYNGSSWVQLGSSGGGGQWLLAGNNIYNGNAGNVGIGTSSNLNERLTVRGNALITFVNGNDLVNGGNIARLRIMGANTGSSSINFLKLDSSEGAAIFYANAVQNLVLRNDGFANQLVLRPDGKIGLGTSSPDERLEITGNAKLTGSAPLIRMEAALGGTGTPLISARYAPGIQFLRQGSSTVLGKIEYVDTVDAANFLRLYTGPSPLNDFTITSDHQVGIGASNPNAKLEVRGTGEVVRIHATADPLLQFTTGNAVGGFGLPLVRKAFLDVNGNDFRVGTNSENDAGKFIVRVNGTDVVNVTPGSNVGIGTASPTPKLHVVGSIRANNNGEALRIDGIDPAINFYQNGVFKSFLAHSNNGLYMGVNNGNIRLDVSNGQVAIGNLIAAASDYKLTVQGRVICEELKVKLSGNWPDYVFSKNYRLKPLSEVASYIEKYRHLPNLPSASTVEKEGIEVGDMQKKLLEKVEELTLYVLELQAQIDALKKQSTKKSN